MRWASPPSKSLHPTALSRVSLPVSFVYDVFSSFIRRFTRRRLSSHPLGARIVVGGQAGSEYGAGQSMGQTILCPRARLGRWQFERPP